MSDKKQIRPLGIINSNLTRKMHDMLGIMHSEK